MKRFTRIASVVAGTIAATLLAVAPAMASQPPAATSQSTVTAGVEEVIGWSTPPQSSLDLGSTAPGQTSSTGTISWAVDSNDGQGTEVQLTGTNNGTTGVTGTGANVGYALDGPFTGSANGPADNATYFTAGAAAGYGITVTSGCTGGWYTGKADPVWAWVINGSPNAITQTDCNNDETVVPVNLATVAPEDTSTQTTSFAFQMPGAVYPDEASATFTFSLIGN